MAIQYSGSTIVNTTFLGNSRAALASNVIAQLLAAGWTSISGEGTDQVLASALTERSMRCAVRVYDPGSGNCARLLLRNYSGALQSLLLYLVPDAAVSYRIIANKYQFFVFVPGPQQPRKFACVAQLWTPDFVTSIADICALQQGSGLTDTDVSANRFTWRNGITSRYAWGQIIGDAATSNADASAQELVVPLHSNSQTHPVCWLDQTFHVSEPLVSSEINSHADPRRIVGQLYDCILMTPTTSVPSDTTVQFDGRTWYPITVGGTGNSYSSIGTLLMLVP